MDWRFSEFPNEGAHGLYVTCVELMILNMDPVAVGERLVDVILENSCHIPGNYKVLENNEMFLVQETTEKFQFNYLILCYFSFTRG